MPFVSHSAAALPVWVTSAASAPARNPPLVFGEGDDRQVAAGFARGLVHADEAAIRPLVRGEAGVFLQTKADGDDEVVAVQQESLDVLGSVARVHRRDEIGAVDESLVQRLLHALPGRLVEAVIVHPAIGGDEADAKNVPPRATGQGGKVARGEQEAEKSGETSEFHAEACGAPRFTPRMERSANVMNTKLNSHSQRY